MFLNYATMEWHGRDPGAMQKLTNKIVVIIL